MEKFILPEPLNQDNLPQEPVKSTGEKFILPPPSGSPVVPSQVGLGEVFDSQYDEGKSITSTQEYWRGEQQPTWQKLLNAPARLWLGLSGELGRTLGNVQATAEAYMYDAPIKDVMNNLFMEASEKATELKDSWFPIYTPEHVANGNLVDNIMSASFYTKEGIDAAAFFLNNYFIGRWVGGLTSMATRSSAVTKLGRKVIENVSSLGLAGFQSHNEALVEAYGVVEELKPVLEKQGLPAQEVETRLQLAFQNTYATNLAILGPSNILMNRMLLGRYFNRDKFLGKVLDPKTGIYTVPSKMASGQIVKEFLKKAGLSTFSEGFWEEGMQGATTELNKDLATRGIDPSLNQYVGSLLGTYADLLGDTNQQKGIYLGGLLGMSGAIVETARETTLNNKVLPELAKLFNNNADDLYKSTSGIISVDPKDPSKKKINLNGAADFIQSNINTQIESTLMEAAQVAGNKEMFDYLYNRFFTKFALPHFQYEDGLETLESYIDLNSKKLVEELKAQDPNFDESKEREFTEGLKEKARSLKNSYDKYEGIVEKLKIPGANPQLVASYKQKLLPNLVAEESYQDFLQKQIEGISQKMTPYYERSIAANQEGKYSKDNFTQAELAEIKSFRELQKKFENAIEDSQKRIDAIFNPEALTKDLERFAVETIKKNLEEQVKQAQAEQVKEEKKELLTGTDLDSLDLAKAYKAWSQLGDLSDAEQFKTQLKAELDALKALDKLTLTDEKLSEIIASNEVLKNLSTDSANQSVINALKRALGIAVSSEPLDEGTPEEFPYESEMLGYGGSEVPSDRELAEMEYLSLPSESKQTTKQEAAPTTKEQPPRGKFNFRGAEDLTRVVPEAKKDANGNKVKDANGKNIYDNSLISRLMAKDPNFISKLDIKVTKNPTPDKSTKVSETLAFGGGPLTITILYNGTVVGFLPSSYQYRTPQGELIDVSSLSPEEINRIFSSKDPINMEAFKNNFNQLRRLETYLQSLEIPEAGLIFNHTHSVVKDYLDMYVSHGFYDTIQSNEPMIPAESFGDKTDVDGKGPVIVRLNPIKEEVEGRLPITIDYGRPFLFNASNFITNGKRPDWLDNAFGQLTSAATNGLFTPASRDGAYEVSQHAMLVKDASGTVEINGQRYSWVFLHPKTMDSKEFRGIILESLQFIADMRESRESASFLEDIKEFNKELSQRIFISNHKGVITEFGIFAKNNGEFLFRVEFTNGITRESIHEVFIDLYKLLNKGELLEGDALLNGVLNAINNSIPAELAPIRLTERSIRVNTVRIDKDPDAKAGLDAFGSLVKLNVKRDNNLHITIKDVPVVESVPQSVDTQSTTSDIGAKKDKYKREDFPDSQVNTRTPVTQKLLDFFAETLGISKFTEDLSKGTYISWLQDNGELGYKVSDLLNSPKKAFDLIAKYNAELAALEQSPTSDIEAKKAYIERKTGLKLGNLIFDRFQNNLGDFFSGKLSLGKMKVPTQILFYDLGNGNFAIGHNGVPTNDITFYVYNKKGEKLGNVSKGERGGNWNNDITDKSLADKINAKYDAELAALEKPVSIAEPVEAMPEESPVLVLTNPIPAKVENSSDEARYKELVAKKNVAGRLSRDEAIELQNLASKINVDDNDAKNSTAPKASKLSPTFEIDLAEAKKYISSILPDWITVEELDGIMTRLDNSGVLFGKFVDDVIYLNKFQAERGTEYHEAFHAVFRTFLTTDQIMRYRDIGRSLLLKQLTKEKKSLSTKLEEFRSEHPSRVGMSEVTLRNLLYEEVLADDFQAYKNNKVKPVPFLQKLYDKILNWFKWLTDIDYRDLNTLYSNIDSGHYRNKSRVVNIFKRGNEAYALLPIGKDASGNPRFEPVDSTEKKVNTIAALIAAKLNNNTKNRAKVEQAFRSIIKEKASEYSIENPAYNDYLYDAAGNPKDFVANGKNLFDHLMDEHFTYTNPAAVESLREMVQYKLNQFKLRSVEEEFEAELESTKSPVSKERDFELGKENVGGWETLDIKVKNYIGLTIHTVTDQFGFKRTVALDVRKTYESLTKTVMNSLGDTEMFTKLIAMRNLDPQAEVSVFIDRFFSDIKFDMEAFENSGTIKFHPSQVPLAQSILKSINLFSADYINVGLDFVTQSSQMGFANKSGLITNQVNRWTDSFRQFKALSTSDKTLALNDLRDVITYDINGDYELTPELLEDRTNDILAKFNKVGFDLSKQYVKLLLLNSPKRLNKLSNSQLDTMIAFKDSMVLTHEEFITNISEILNLISKGADPFSRAEREESVKEDKKMVKEGRDALSRVQKIARDNAIFDERIITPSFKNAENKSIYWLQQGSYHMKRFIALKREAYRQQLFQDSVYGEYLKTNFLLTNPKFIKLLENSDNIKRIDGVYDSSNKQSSNKQKGASFSSMKPRDLALFMLSTALDRKKLSYRTADGKEESVLYNPMFITTMETSSTGDLIDVPVVNETISKEGVIAESYINSIFAEIEREFKRIQKVKTDDPKDHWHDYHNGKKRGHDFWITKKLLLQNEDLYKKLINGETTPQESREEINKLINSYLQDLSDKFIQDLISWNIIGKSSDGKIHNKVLDKRYFGLGEKPVFESTNVETNLKQVFLGNYINNIAVNQLMKGDMALQVSDPTVDPTNYFKRNKSMNNAGTHFKSFFKNSFRILVHPEPMIGNTKIADAQARGTLESRIAVLQSMGRFTPEVKRVYDILLAGRRDLTMNEHQILVENGADLIPQKYAGSDDKVAVKVAVASLDPYLVGFYKGDEFLPRPGFEDLYNMFIQARESGAEFLMPPTGMKRGIKEIVDWGVVASESSMYEMAAEHLMLQMENPSNKTYTTYSTQQQRLLISEITSDEGKRLLKKYEEVTDRILNNTFRDLSKALKDLKSGKIDVQYFKSIAVKTLEKTGASDNILAYFSPENNYNLNNPATLDKLIQLYTSAYKSAFKLTVPGYKTTLQSDYGINLLVKPDGTIITRDKFDSDSDRYYDEYKAGKLTTRKLRVDVLDKATGVVYSECMIPKHFAEMFGLEPGDRLPDAIVDLFGTRIPGTDKHSMTPLKIVDVLPTSHGSSIVLPHELIDRIGHDFDVDSFYIHRPEHYIVYSEDGTPIFRKYGNTDSDSPYQQYINWVISYDVFSTKYAFNLDKLSDPAIARQEVLALFDRHLKNAQLSKSTLLKVREGNIPETLKTFVLELADKYSNMLGDVSKDEFISMAITNNLGFPKNSIIFQTLKQMGMPTTEAEYNLHKARFGEPNTDILYNELLDISRKLWSLPELKEAREEPESDSDFKTVAGKIAEYTLDQSIIDSTPRSELYNQLKEFRDPFSMNGLIQAHEQNMAGKNAVGSAVNITQAFVLLNSNKIPLTKKALDLKVSLGGTVVPHNDFNSLKTRLPDINGVVQRIFKNLSSGTTATVDAGKTNYPGLLNLGIDSLSVVSYAEIRGLTLELAVYLANVPSIKQFMTDIKQAALRTDAEINARPDKVLNKTLGKIREDIDKLIKEGNVDPDMVDKIQKSMEDTTLVAENLIFTLKAKNKVPAELNDALKYHVTNYKLLKIWDALRSESMELMALSRIQKLAKGLEGTAEFGESIEQALETLGFTYSIIDNKVVLKKIENADTYLDYTNVVMNDKRINTYIVNTLQFLHDSGQLIFLRTPVFRSMMKIAKANLRPVLRDKQNVVKDMSKYLNSFLVFKAYRKHLAAKELTEDWEMLNPGLVFKHMNTNGKLDAIQTLEFYKKEYPELLSNPFIYALSTNTNGDISKIFHDTRSKGRSSEIERKQIDGFTLLYRDARFKPLAKTLFNYLIMKDAGLFKNNSFIQLIPPFMFKEMSSAMDNVGEALTSDTKEQFIKHFGVTKEDLLDEFLDLYFPFKKHTDIVNKLYKGMETLGPYVIDTHENGFTIDITKGISNFNMREDTTFTNKEGVVAENEKQLEADKKRKSDNLKAIRSMGSNGANRVFDIVEVEKPKNNYPHLAVKGIIYFYDTEVKYVKNNFTGRDETVKTYKIYKLVGVDGKAVRPSQLKDGSAVGAKLTYELVKPLGVEGFPFLPFATDLNVVRQISDITLSRTTSSKAFKPTLPFELESIPSQDDSGDADMDNYLPPDDIFAEYAQPGKTSYEPTAEDMPDDAQMLELGKPLQNLPKAAGAIVTEEETSTIPENTYEPTDAELQEAMTLGIDVFSKPSKTTTPSHPSSEYVKVGENYVHSVSKESITETQYNDLVALEQALNANEKNQTDCNK